MPRQLWYPTSALLNPGNVIPASQEEPGKPDLRAGRVAEQVHSSCSGGAVQYVRDHVNFPLEDGYFEQRMTLGWRLRVIEWEQEDESSRGAEEPNPPATVPYGLQILPESAHLAQDPAEMSVLLTILEMIVRDQSVPLIAEELNRRNLKARSGRIWTPSAVFDLLPRVIEMGPSLLQSREWKLLRPTGSAVIPS